MQKNIKFIGILIVSLLFSSCGSNTKKDPEVLEAPQKVLPYSFYNATTPLIVYPEDNHNEVGGCGTSGCHDKNITKTETKIEPEPKVYTLSVQLLKYALVAPGEAIQMKPFDYTYGTLKASIIDTDASGIATFEYIPPEAEAYQKIRGKEYTIEAVFLLPEDMDDQNETKDPIGTPPKIILSQKFLLKFL